MYLLASTGFVCDCTCSSLSVSLTVHHENIHLLLGGQGHCESKSVLPKNTTQWSRPGFEPESLVAELHTITITVHVGHRYLLTRTQHTLVMRSSLLSMQYLSSSSIFITLIKPDSSVLEPTIVDTVPLPSSSSSATSSSSTKIKYNTVLTILSD